MLEVVAIYIVIVVSTNDSESSGSFHDDDVMVALY